MANSNHERSALASRPVSAVQRISLGLTLAIAIGLGVAACFEAYTAHQDTEWLRTVFLGEILEKTEKKLSRIPADPNAPLSGSGQAGRAASGQAGRIAAQLETMALATARLSGVETTQQGKLSGPYRLLKAPPADAARIGGQCGNLTRLFTTTARISGLKARRAHLYQVKGLDRPIPEAYVHAIVEVEIGDRWIIVDPLYGVVYRNENGELADSADLAAQPGLVRANIENRPIPDDYLLFPPADYNFDLYQFQELRRVRWTILPGGERIRSLVASVIGEEGANLIAYPHSFERPHVFLAAVYGMGGLAFAGLGAFLYRRSRRA